MELQTLVDRALEVRSMYDGLNQRERGVVWGGKDLMAGFVGDVGDLSKIIMAKHGLRAMDDIDANLPTSSPTVCGRFWSWLTNTRSTLE